MENQTPEPAENRRFFWNTSQNQTQVVAVLILLAVVILIIGGLYLAQAAQDITNKNDIRQLQATKVALDRNNELLKAEIAELQRVDNLATRAYELGYRPAGVDNIQWIVVDGYVYDQPVPTPTLFRQTPTPEVYEENFAGWLRRQFNNLRREFEEWSN
jgi:cell division protein FtsL